MGAAQLVSCWLPCSILLLAVGSRLLVAASTSGRKRLGTAGMRALSMGLPVLLARHGGRGV